MVEIKHAKIKLQKLDIKKVQASDLGRTILRNDRGFWEYGVLMGYTDRLVIVNFNYNRFSIKLRPSEVYFVKV